MPNNKRQFNIADVILIALIILLVVFVYEALGGDVDFLSNLSAKSRNADPMDGVFSGLDSLGQGIGNLFSGFTR